MKVELQSRGTATPVAVNKHMALVTAVVLKLIISLLKKVVERRLWWPSAMLLQKAMLKNFGYPDETCTSDVLLKGFAFILCISSHHFLMFAMMLLGVGECRPRWPVSVRRVVLVMALVTAVLMELAEHLAQANCGLAVWPACRRY